MGMFNSGMRKPRRFNHQYIYVNERKEKLDKMEEQAKRELGMLSEKEFSPEDIRGKFVEGTTHLKRRKEGIMYDLKHTNATISEICYKYGFESLPHFSNFCKKSFGASPRAIRNPKDK